jgi:hypothetical protein
VALHSTWLTHHGSCLLTVGVSSIATLALRSGVFQYCSDILQHLHVALDTETPHFRILFTKCETQRHDNVIFFMIVGDPSVLFLRVQCLYL